MAQLATSLSRQVNLIVVDQTGLIGIFDFELEWTPEGLPQRAVPRHNPNSFEKFRA
jgi:uncharacterized protein (TIGR03435 family)